MERTIDDCFKLKGLKECCIGCLNYEPEVIRWNRPNGLENWIHCAKSDGCYYMTEERECGD